MKRRYIKPAFVSIEFETSPLMTVASGEQSSAGVGSGTVGDKNPDLSSNNRSEWGNLWK